MEEIYASTGAETGPEDRAAPVLVASLDAGRLGGVLCELQRARFDGVLHISSSERSAALGFRDGTPVTFDDPTPGHTLAEQLVEREQLTREQCNTVLARMTDSLVDDEAIAFFEHAVQLGYLTEEDANVELSSRIRAGMLQLFSLRDCETSLLPGKAALLERREFPQNLGALLYMGVRTFYDEEYLSSLHPDLTKTYVRLSGAPATIAHFFGLDDDEFHLLRSIQPTQAASELLSKRKVERVHLLALLLLLRLAKFCDVSDQPASPRPGRELPREDKSFAGRMPGPPSLPREDKSFAGRMPDPHELAREDRSFAGRMPEREDRSFAGRLPEREDRSFAGRMPEREDRSVAGRMPEPREDKSFAGRMPEREDRSVAGRMPVEPREDKSFAGRMPEREDRSVAGRMPVEPREDKSFAGRMPAEPSAPPPQRSVLPDPPAPRPTAKPSVDATQEALLEAAARTARMRRSLPARRNSKHADAPAQPAAEGGSVVAPTPPAPSKHTAPVATGTTSPVPAGTGPLQKGATGDYAKAHLKELIARRKQTAAGPESISPANQRDPARELREARTLLHGQHYARAEKVLSGLLELAPNNELYKTYQLWARWRAQPEAAEASLPELQELAKKLISDNEHGGFAAYVLGYICLHDKRDDMAEKFFKRAFAADRGNKDAERHLLILERRKLADASGSGNRKLFGIQLPNSKPKP
jgi:hypothetical protein